jgi:hypothetical protein
LELLADGDLLVDDGARKEVELFWRVLAAVEVAVEVLLFAELLLDFALEELWLEIEEAEVARV